MGAHSMAATARHQHTAITVSTDLRTDPMYGRHGHAGSPESHTALLKSDSNLSV